jgi:hypothetical protein
MHACTHTHVHLILCHIQELHVAASFQPPPSAPLQLLERAASLTRQSLARRSRLAVKSRTGAGAGNDDGLSRISSALARVSRDPASAMQAGRSARPRGDGRLEVVVAGVEMQQQQTARARLQPTCEEDMAVSTFGVQAFEQLSEIAWGRSSALTKLLTIAAVCNKARFISKAGTGSEQGAVAASVMLQPGGEDDRQLLGDATDCGLLRYCDRIAPSSLVRMAYKKVWQQ